MIERLSRRHVVLLGVGHTNAHVLRMWRMKAPPDTDLTCLSNYPEATYSGMLPAALAGQLEQPAMTIDLVRLCASVSARLITDPVVGLDPEAREIRFANRPNIPFDVLSIGIGSVPTCDHVQVEGETLVRIKPMQTFLQRLRAGIQSRVATKVNGPLRVVIVGSGVAGIEVALCLPSFLKSETSVTLDLRMVTRSEHLAPELERKTQERLVSLLQARGISLVTGSAVTKVTPESIILEDGQQFEADLVIWATGAAPPPLLQKLGLRLDQRGFLETDSTLQSVSLGGVFAVGDSGSMRDQPVPKAGVYAVRQSPVLWKNIHRYLNGETLIQYRPQRSFMKLINLGDGQAIGQWKGFVFSGRWVMRLKHHIDTKFMNMYRIQPPMAMEETANDDGLGQQCRGCGCKLGPETLSSALKTDVGQDYEDAAEIASSEQGTLIASTDFFSSPFQDAYLSGRVAALHSASDVIASAGTPTAALANIVLPPGDAAEHRRALSDLLAGARQEFEAMGANLVGGHTIVGPRMEVGFTVIGNSTGRLIRKGNLQTGDRLYLTKPLGIGLLLAAQMRGECRGKDYVRLVDAMLTRQHPWVAIAKESGITAGTDITGFGLIGHLFEMLQSSGVSAVLQLDSIPVLPGATEAVNAGIQSTLAPANHRIENRIRFDNDCRNHPKFELLFDPQTCGGLLFGVPQQAEDGLITRAAEHGLAAPVRVGMVESDTPTSPALRLEVG